MDSELENLTIEDISALTTDTSEGLKSSLANMNPTKKDLKTLKSAEKSGKDRDKVIEYIENKINELEVVEDLGIAQEDVREVENLLEEVANLEDAENSEEGLENIDQDRLLELVGGTVEDVKEFVEDEKPNLDVLELLLEAEEKVKDRKTAKNFIKKSLKQRKLSNDVKNTKKDIKSLKNDLRDVSEDSSANIVQNTDKDSEKTNKDSNSEAVGEDEETTETESEAEEETTETEKDEEEKNKETEKEDENLDDIERKKQILKSLETNIGEDKLQDISIDELKQIKKDQNERQEIISELEKHGFDPEELKKASTQDLKTVLEETEEDNSEKVEDEKSEEEIRQEAEEDLQMLMGAVRNEEDEEDDESDRLSDLRQKLASKFRNNSEEEEEESTEMNASDVKDVLDSYKNLENAEASIKTAHIMKGYLETELGINRELTYKELAEELPKDKEDMSELAEFFQTMHKDEYTQNVDVDAKEVINLCENIVSQL